MVRKMSTTAAAVRISTTIPREAKAQGYGAMDLIRAGIGRDKAYALINGHERIPTLPELLIISDLFHVPMWDLIDIDLPGGNYLVDKVPDEQ